MTLEKHVMDTMKEWQIKMGSFDSGIRLYYPKLSICRDLCLDAEGIGNEVLCGYIEHYFEENAGYLGKVKVTADGKRFCLLVGKEGCDYVEQNVPVPEFLTEFLEVLKEQNMQSVMKYFEEYAKKHGTEVCVQTEEGGQETVLYFENERVEPYVYCIDHNEFGITYHRFTKEDYGEL